MTEVTEEPVLVTALVRHAFYRHQAITRIATEDYTLMDLTGTDTYTVSPQEVVLIEEPGSPEWVDRMVRIRNSAVRALTNSQRDLHARISHFERMSEAILEKAVEHKWCEEYDAFAEEWGLPSRLKEFQVTMTLRVEARNEDAAVEAVSVAFRQFGNDGFVTDPEFNVEEVEK